MNKKRDPISLKKKLYIFIYILIYQSFYLIAGLFIIIFCLIQPNLGIGKTSPKYYNTSFSNHTKLVLG
jgi:hypothetical protein